MGRGSSKWYNLPTWLFLLSLGANSASIGWALKLASQLRDANVKLALLDDRRSASSQNRPIQPQQSQTEELQQQQQQKRQQQQQQHVNEIGRLQSLIEQMQREHQERLVVVESENHDLKDRCSELEYLFQQQKDHHNDVTQRRLADHKQLELQNLSLSEQLSAAATGTFNANHATAIAALESQLEQETKRQQQSETMIAELNEQLSSLRMQSADLNQELAIAITKVDELQKQLALVSTERDMFRNQFEHTNEENKQLVAKSQTAEESLHVELEKWKNTAASAEESNNSLKSNLAQLETEKRELSRVIARLEETIIQENQMREQLSTEKQAAVIARQQSEHDMQEILNDKTELRVQIDDLAEKLLQLQIEHESLRTQNSLLSKLPLPPNAAPSSHHEQSTVITDQTILIAPNTETTTTTTAATTTTTTTAAQQPSVSSSSSSENGPTAHVENDKEPTSEKPSRQHQDSHNQSHQPPKQQNSQSGARRNNKNRK